MRGARLSPCKNQKEITRELDEGAGWTVTIAASTRLPLRKVVTFSLANLPIAALSIAVLVYLPPYFAGHLRAPMAMVGGVWMTIRLIDIPVDVTLALAMDRTRTRIGRYRPWLVAGAPVVMVGLYQLYMAPVGFSAGYLLVWLLVLYLGWSMMSLAMSAWGDQSKFTKPGPRSGLRGEFPNVPGAFSANAAVLKYPAIVSARERPDA